VCHRANQSSLHAEDSACALDPHSANCEIWLQTSSVRRDIVILFLGGAAIAWPFTVRALKGVKDKRLTYQTAHSAEAQGWDFG
jgi:hypothetical protein